MKIVLVWPSIRPIVKMKVFFSALRSHTDSIQQTSKQFVFISLSKLTQITKQTIDKQPASAIIRQSYWVNHFDQNRHRSSNIRTSFCSRIVECIGITEKKSSKCQSDSVVNRKWRTSIDDRNDVETDEVSANDTLNGWSVSRRCRSADRTQFRTCHFFHQFANSLVCMLHWIQTMYAVACLCFVGHFFEICYLKAKHFRIFRILTGFILFFFCFIPILPLEFHWCACWRASVCECLRNEWMK